jgi:hypothetical protein
MNPSEIQKIFGPPLKGHVSPVPLKNLDIVEIAGAFILSYLVYRGIIGVIDDFNQA